jgi:hypothetical protein
LSRGEEPEKGFKVPRQCPLALLADVLLRKGKALGSEEVKELASELCNEQRRDVERGFHSV